MLGATIAAILLLGAATGGEPAQGAALVETPARSLRGIVDKAVAKGFSGTVLVAKGNRRIMFDGFGAMAGNSVQRDSPFWIASGAKQFTSAAILCLAEAGHLRLDDRLDRFFPGAPPDKAAITVRQLLSHTSGLAQSYVFEGARDRAAAVSAMFAEPLKAPPGGGFNYSNSNYALAAAIIEVASGQDYAHYVSRLWERAGLHATGFSGMPGATLVSPVSGELPPRLRTPAWGGHNMFSSAGDLFHWYRALRTGKILRPESVRILFAPVAPIVEGQTALGWFLGKTSAGNSFIFTRGNDDFGANSLVYAYPDQDIVIVVLTHAGDASGDMSWSRTIQRDLADALHL